jgi:hypothetical protein
MFCAFVHELFRFFFHVLRQSLLFGGFLLRHISAHLRQFSSSSALWEMDRCLTGFAAGKSFYQPD